MSYINHINDFYSKLNELIAKYETSLSEVITNKKDYETLKEDLNELVSYSNNLQQSLNDTINKEHEKNNHAHDKYNRNISITKNLLLDKLNKIKNEKIKIVNRKKRYNEKEIKIIESKITDIKDEITFTNCSSKQQIYALSLQMSEEIERLSYQNDLAIKAYNDFITISNESMNTKIDLLHSSSSKRTFKFDEANKSLKDFLTKSIDNHNTKYNEIEENLKQEIKRVKDFSVVQTIKLNGRINYLSELKNEEIENYKDNHKNELSIISLERQKYHQETQDKSKEILKIFAKTLTEIDNKIDMYTKKYNSEKEKLVRKFYYENYALEKEFSSLYVEYQKKLNSFANNNGSKHLIKSLKISLKIKKKQIEKKKVFLEKSHKKEYYELEKRYYEEIEKFKNNKFISEIGKNYDINILNLKDHYNHLTITHKEEIEENKFNNEILIANRKLTIKVNELRANNEIRNKIHEKEIATINEKFKESLENINKQKNSLAFDLKYSNELDNIVHKKESSVLEKQKQLIQILSLLEIEKNKILKNFNNENYNICVSKQKVIFGNSESLILNKRDFFNNISKHSIELQKHKITYKNNFLGYDLMKEQNEEVFLSDKEKTLYSRDIGLKKYELYLNRFRFESILVKRIYKTYICIMSKFENFNNNLLLFFCNLIIDRTLFYDLISRFISDYLRISYQLKKDMILEFGNYEKQIVESRISFETGFKYKSMFNDLEEKYQNDKLLLKQKQDSIIDTIKNYQGTIDYFSKKIYDLENQITYLKVNIENESKLNKTNTLDSLYFQLEEIKKERKEYRVKIQNTTNLKDLLQKDMYVIPKKLRDLKKHFDLDNKKISNEQKKECYVYFHIISLININTKKSISKYNKKLEKMSILMKENSYKTQKQIRNIIYNNKISLISYNHFFINFYKSSRLQVCKELDKIKERYEYICLKSLKEQKKNHLMKEEKREQKLSSLKYLYKKTEQEILQKKSKEKRDYFLKNKNIQEIYNTSLESLDFKKNNNSFKFHQELSSMNDNIDILIKKTTLEINSIEKKYLQNRKNLLIEYSKLKTNLDEKYEQSIKNGKMELAAIPNIIKFQSNQIKNQVKAQNKSLLLENKKAQHISKMFCIQKTNEIVYENEILNKEIQALESSKKKEIQRIKHRSNGKMLKKIKKQIEKQEL